MNGAENPPSIDRAALGFEVEAKRAFGFLTATGFANVASSPYKVSFRKGGIDIDIYHEDFEIGFDLTRGGSRYSLGEIMDVTNPDSEITYRNFVARTAEHVAMGLEQLAQLAQRYAAAAIADDPEMFVAMTNYRVERLARMPTIWAKN